MAAAARGAAIGGSLVLLATIALGPSLVVLPFSASIYRRWTSSVVATWQTLVAALLESPLYGSVRYVLSGCTDLPAAVDGDAPILLICNHRTRLDWMLLWPLLVRWRRMAQLKIVLKAPLRSTPWGGWACQQARYIFLDRKYATDASHLDACLRMLGGAGGARAPPYALLLFPEGTDLNPQAQALSAAFADRSGLRRYQHVLHPRTTGFTQIVTALRGDGGGGGGGRAPVEEGRAGAATAAAAPLSQPLHAVVDLTLAYAGGRMPQAESQLLSGAMPRSVHVHARVYAARDLPSDEAALAAWLTDRFAEKEAALARFYAAPGRGLHVGDADTGGDGAFVAAAPEPSPPPSRAYAAAFAALLVTAAVTGGLAATQPRMLGGWLVLYHGLMGAVAPALGGLDRVELWLWGPRPPRRRKAVDGGGAVGAAA